MAPGPDSQRRGYPPRDQSKPVPVGYELLPFRFQRFDADRYILVSEVGEYTFLPPAVLRDFIGKRLTPTSAAYTDLKRKHLLMDSAREAALELLATKYRSKKSFLRGFTGLHLFVVTLRCDNACRYCQVSRTSADRAGYDMSQETARRAIEVMFGSPARDLKVEFQGGEPLLNFDVVRYIVETVEARNVTEGRDVQFVIATNLVHLTDAMLDFCRAHRVAISTSLDGPAFIHNANRPRPGGDAYASTCEGIRRVRESLGDDAVSALMTTTRVSLDRPREIVDEYVRQGFPSIFLRPVSPFGFAAKSRRMLGYEVGEFVEFYRQALEYIIELNRTGVGFSETYAEILLTKILTPFATRYVNLQSPAGAGISVAAYNYDGGVYVSDEARMLAEMGDLSFRLGNVHEHTYEELFGGPLLRSLVANSCLESQPGCCDCAYQPFCGADPDFHYATQGDLVGHKPTSDFCAKNTALISLLLRLLEDNETAKILSGWVHGRRLVPPPDPAAKVPSPA